MILLHHGKPAPRWLFDRDGDDLSVTGLTFADDSPAVRSTGDATSGWTFSPTADFNGTVEADLRHL